MLEACHHDPADRVLIRRHARDGLGAPGHPLLSHSGVPGRDSCGRWPLTHRARPPTAPTPKPNADTPMQPHMGHPHTCPKHAPTCPEGASARLKYPATVPAHVEIVPVDLVGLGRRRLNVLTPEGSQGSARRVSRQCREECTEPRRHTAVTRVPAGRRGRPGPCPGHCLAVPKGGSRGAPRPREESNKPAGWHSANVWRAARAFPHCPQPVP